MRPDELSFVVRRSRRITKDSSSSSIIRLVPVFIFYFLYFIVFIPKFYKRQAKMYHNTSFTILTQKRIQYEKKNDDEK